MTIKDFDRQNRNTCEKAVLRENLNERPPIFLKIVTLEKEVLIGLLNFVENMNNSVLMFILKKNTPIKSLEKLNENEVDETFENEREKGKPENGLQDRVRRKKYVILFQEEVLHF